MPKLLFSLLVFSTILGACGCNINEIPGLNCSIPEGRIPKAGVILSGGEFLDGMLRSPVQPLQQILAVANDNILWMTTFIGVIAYYDNRFQIFDAHNTNIPCSDITQIFVDSHNKKWFGNNKGDVFTFDNQNWGILPTPSDTKNIAGIAEDSEGTIWVLGEQGGRGQGILWSYEGEQINRIYSNRLGDKRPNCFAIDSTNNIWVGTRYGGLYKVNGDECENLQSIFPNSFINDIYYDKRDDILYISTDSGYSYIEGKEIYCEGGIFTCKDENFELIVNNETAFPSSKRTPHINIMLSDSRGNLWLGYRTGGPGYGIALGRISNGQWISFGQDSPIENYIMNAMASDNNGRIWSLVTDSSSKQIYLAIFNGRDWATTSLPVLSSDPRIWWHEKELFELFKYPALSVNIGDTLNNPLSYSGKKISLIGKPGNMFDLLDKDGTDLRIFPYYQDELQQFLKQTGLDQEITKSEYQEYIGYLEYGGCCGQVGGWPPMLFVTEVYPYTSSEQQENSYRALYENYVNTLAKDKKVIHSVVDKWIAARRSGNIEELKELYPPDSGFYKYLLTEKGREDIKNNIMDVTINESSIKVDGTNAEVDIQDATVKPERYAEPGTGAIGIYELHHIKLQKYGTGWKITEIFYFPHPAPDSVPTPTPPPQPASQ